MKKFIIYVLLLFGGFLFSDMLLVYFTRKSLAEHSIKLPPDKRVLILGDSHLECALNDSILDNAVNLCLSGEAYIYTYIKMKLVLAANPQIKTIWLSYNFHSLSADTEDWLYNKEGVLNIDRYACFFEKEEKTFFSKNVRYYLSIMRLPYTYRKLLLKNILGVTTNYSDWRWGGYLRLDKNNLSKSASTEVIFPSSSIQKLYLDNIVEYCLYNNVNLIFINSPVKDVSTDKLKNFREYKNVNYSNIQLWNYSTFSLPDSCFADAEHLNYKGAEIFSKYLQHLSQ
ncbi:MAG: hypothetical protein LBR34_07330 [Prevotella sp.]|jgi:hypothetical protein|nr:hypothetical protein [Prevotella sp.]